MLTQTFRKVKGYIVIHKAWKPLLNTTFEPQ